MELIAQLIDFNNRNNDNANSSSVIRKKAGDDWF